MRLHYQVWSQSEAPEDLITVGAEDLITVGVFISPRDDPARPWDTTMYAPAGDLDLPWEDVEHLNELFDNALISEEEEANLAAAVKGSWTPH